MKQAIRILVAASALAAGLSAAGATPSPAATRPVLSGRIVSGVWSPGGAGVVSPYCSTAPDCAAWLASGCSPALAGRDPAWATSIADVRRFADGSTRRVFSARSSFSWGVLQIELWDRECRRVGGWPCARWSSCDHRPAYIPKDAVWITIVSSGDNANTTWSLR